MAAQIPQTGVAAVPAHPLLKEVAALLWPVSAGHQQRHGLPFPEGGPLFLAIVLVHSVDQAVQKRLHRRRTVPGIDGGGQHHQLTFQNHLKDGLRIIFAHTAEPGPVPLAGPAGNTWLNVFLIKPDGTGLCSTLFQFLPKRLQQCGSISLPAGAPHQNTDIHHRPPLPAMIAGQCVLKTVYPVSLPTVKAHFSTASKKTGCRRPDGHKTMNPTDITIGRIFTSVYKLADGKSTGDSRISGARGNHLDGTK